MGYKKRFLTDDLAEITAHIKPHQLGGTMAVERFTLQLHDENDADLVEYLNRQENKNGAMKQALRAQMEKEAVDGS